MRASVADLLLALLLAALSVSGSDIETRIYEKGHFAEITVTTGPNIASKCYLVTPSNITVDILATEDLSDKYEYRNNSLSSCRVRINNLDKNDEGLWSLHAVMSSKEDTEFEVNNDTEYEVKEQINILVEGSDSAESVISEESSKQSAEDTVTSEPEEEDNVSVEHPAISLETESETPEEEDNVSVEHPAISLETGSETPEEEDNVSVEHPAISLETESETPEEEDNVSVEHPAISLETESETPEEEDNVSVEHPAISLETESETPEEEDNVSVEHPAISLETESETPEEEDNVSVEHPAISLETESETPEEEDNVSVEHPAISLETESVEASSSEEQQVETQWLGDLQFITRTGLNVDINLPRTVNSEKCTLTKPDGTIVDMNSVVPGVTAHSASEYVSCRVVLGPMEPSLLGNWTLCGYYEENTIEHRRCQNAEIVWRNTANPDSMWQTTINAKFDHVVHFGGTLTPAVRGSGSVVSCHLVTPDHEDLFVTRDREYPNVRLVQNTDSACSIAIGPIADSHLGDWAVYGTFSSALWGYNEVRLPIKMELYDEDDPYAQAYNVTTLNPIQHVVNLGSTIPVEVTGTGAIDVCQFTVPSGQTYLSTGTMPAGISVVNNHRVACQLSVGPITEEMIGEWLLVGKFSNRDVHTENRLSFSIIREDPANPIEEDRTVQLLDQQYIDTAIGASHRVAIPSDFFSTFQSCHIRTPEGLQYTIMEGFHIPGIEVETGSNLACGVTVKVSEDLIGTWTLMAREIRSSEAIERRLPFVIYVEETVEAVPNVITITEDNSFHVRLAKPTDLHDTCELHDNNDQQVALARPDTNHQETCGFVVSSVDTTHNGTWNIVYGTKIIYKAPVLINVTAKGQAFAEQVTWIEHTSVSQNIGPEEAVYCRVISPVREVVFDGFGRCHVAVDRVLKDQHEATWTMEVGFAGRIVTETYKLDVKVTAADKKPEVSTSVVTNKPKVELTCSVTSSQQKTGCLFRGPAGEVLVANQGVSEDRYVFHVNQTSIDSDSYYYSCSLQITEPVTTDLGLWRCDLDSEEENYYGFLTVLFPWAMQGPNVAASVVAEPVLVATVTSVSAEERAPAVLACAARAPLRYCYFRAPNGTIFNVQPGMSSPAMQYVGAGLDAGECGVRIEHLLYTDNGTWSCHADVNGSEQSHPIAVFVHEEFQLRASRERRVIEGQVAGYRRVEYCRFVRFDGFGFTSDNAPHPYIDESDLSTGHCRIQIASVLDWTPWTVVTKIQGRAGEISRVTDPSWSTPTPVYYNPLFMWLPLLTIMAGCLLMAAALAPARNRRWAAERASSMRASLRDNMRRFPSLRKKQPPAADTNAAA